MKKLSLIFTMALAACLFQACGNSGHKDTVDTADSVNAATDTNTTAAADSSGTGIAEEDSKFAVTAADGGMAEVALGQLALQKGTSAQVKEFAAMMVKDHTKANTELKAVAGAKNITLPAAPGEDNQKIAADLSKKTGADFDKAYIDEMVKDHEKDVKLFEDYTKDGKDTTLKAFATKTLPVLKAHLTHIKTISDKKS